MVADQPHAAGERRPDHQDERQPVVEARDLRSRPVVEFPLELAIKMNVLQTGLQGFSCSSTGKEPTQQCGGVSEPPAAVDIGKNYLTDHFGRHAPPLGDLLLLPTRADRTFRWPSPKNELFSNRSVSSLGI